MVTVYGKCTTENQRDIARFFGLSFEGYSTRNGSCEKCLSRKAVHNWVGKFSQGRTKVSDDDRAGRPVETATEETAAGGMVLGPYLHEPCTSSQCGDGVKRNDGTERLSSWSGCS
jgi:hypothetical protein